MKPARACGHVQSPAKITHVRSVACQLQGDHATSETEASGTELAKLCASGAIAFAINVSRALCTRPASLGM